MCYRYTKVQHNLCSLEIGEFNTYMHSYNCYGNSLCIVGEPIKGFNPLCCFAVLSIKRFLKDAGNTQRAMLIIHVTFSQKNAIFLNIPI